MLIGTFVVSGIQSWAPSSSCHFTGYPVIHDTHRIRYKVFYYCNVMASMVIVILLLNSIIYKYRRSLLVMKTAMVKDLIDLLGAYASGT